MNVKLLILLLITALFWRCSDDDDTMDCPSSDPDPVLIDIKDFTIIPAYTDLLTELEALQLSADNFTATPLADNLSALRGTLKSAWKSWQASSPFEFGPAADNALRANVNTFPVDSFSVMERIENEEFVLIANDTKGFPCLDLLLNGIGADDTEILAHFTGDNAASFSMYLNTVVNDIFTRVDAVKSTWENDYSTGFTTNTGFATGSSFSLYINAYIQDWEQIKRERLALPLGLLTFEVPLPDRVECYYGGYSTELALAHAQSHYDIYLSEEHLGIQELVEDVTSFAGENGETLDEALIAQFDLALEKLQEVPDPLSEAVIDDFDTVNEAYLALQDMVVLLKTDMTSGLGISINFADNDGD